MNQHLRIMDVLRSKEQKKPINYDGGWFFRCLWEVASRCFLQRVSHASKTMEQLRYRCGFDLDQKFGKSQTRHPQ
jgi:hypothetical protein